MTTTNINPSIVNKFFMKGSELVYIYEFIQPASSASIYISSSLGFITYRNGIRTQRLSIDRYSSHLTNLEKLNYKGWTEIPPELVNADDYEMIYKAVENQKGKKYKAILQLLKTPDEFRILYKQQEIRICYDNTNSSWCFRN